MCMSYYESSNQYDYYVFGFKIFIFMLNLLQNIQQYENCINPNVNFPKYCIFAFLNGF